MLLKIMNLRPLPNFVLLTCPPRPDRTASGVWLVERNTETADVYEWVVVACGSSVPFDIQPGMRVIVDPNSMSNRVFTHEGRKYQVTPWKEVKLLIGVAAE